MLKGPGIIRAANKGVAWLAALALWLTASVAGADTLLMPNRDYKMGVPEVVWGITTQANGTAFDLDYGDGSVHQTGTVADRSYIAFQHTYALSGPFTVTLKVGTGAGQETATAAVNVYNPGSLSAFDLRNLNVNRAIQDGLRYLWTIQSNRTNFDTTNTTNWTGTESNTAFTALVTLAFENHGYRLPNNDTAPTGLYEKYVVQRGINFVINNLGFLTLGPTGTTPSNDPCVSVPAPVCVGVVADPNNPSRSGYINAIAILPFASSGAANRHATLGASQANPAISINGMSYGEILQRMVNSTIWGQNDSGNGRGGWYYNFNSTSSDGSADGWNMFGLLDAMGAGANVPQWVKTEWANTALPNGLNNDGSFDYQADASRTSLNSINHAKTGIGIQGMFFATRPLNDPDLQNALNFLATLWNEGTKPGFGFQCQGGFWNKGCGYAMLNIFKGLKLYGVQTLPGIGRAAGPGTIPADDWYADYVDWLIANQTAPTTVGGGNWAPLGFSSQTRSSAGESAMAELILSPVALTLPDPTLFSTLGLQQGNPLSTNPATEALGGTHMVTAVVQAQGGAPVPGATVTFNVISGPNAGKTGVGTSDVNGITTMTYIDTGGLGDDQVQASIGALTSNVLVVHWINATLQCDANGDGKVDAADLAIIRRSFGASAGGADVRDVNGNGVIDIVDLRFCEMHQTPAGSP